METTKNTLFNLKFTFVLILFSAWMMNSSFSQLPVSPENESTFLRGTYVCSFTVGAGSPNSGTYVVSANEDEAFAFNDIENEQFVIEIRGDNYIDIMLIIEKPALGNHPFTMEMQVSINISKNGGKDYFSFDNHQENGGGYIQIDRIDDVDDVDAKVTGSFSGLFNDSSTGNDKPVKVNGKFSVKRM